MDAIAEFWTWLTQRNPAPDEWVVITTGVAAVAVIMIDGLWRVAHNVITIAHEGGHALLALLTGRRLHGIRLHMDTSGATFTRGQRRGLSAILTLLAGYLFPAVVGLVSAWLLSLGLVVMLLWLSIVLLAAMALFIRNFYGVLAIGLTGAAVFSVAWWAPNDVQGTISYASTWFFLLGAVRPVWELWHQRRRGGQRDSDPDQLAGITGIPGGFWLLLFAVINLGCLGLGAGLLIPTLWQ